MQWWLIATDSSNIASEFDAYAGRRHLLDSIAHHISNHISKAEQHGGAQG